MTDRQLRVQICEVGQMLWQRDLIGAAQGNMSVRLDPDRIICTPAGRPKGFLAPDELLIADARGRWATGAHPSTEIKLHLGIYQWRPDCQAVIHAHPVVATGFALAGQTIPNSFLPEAAAVLGDVALVPFAPSGTDALAEAIRPLLPGRSTFLLSHHGAVTLGTDLWDAFYRMETLERIARTFLAARQLGGEKPLPQ